MVVSTEVFRTIFPSCAECISPGASSSTKPAFHGNFVDSPLCKECLIRKRSGVDSTSQSKTSKNLDGDAIFVGVSRRLVQRLLAQEKCDSENVDEQENKKVREESIAVMQSKMRKGTQEKSDFNLFGCWGYVHAKFSHRARLAFNSVHHVINSTSLLDDVKGLQVCSFGGGPANDIFGAMVAIELAKAARTFSFNFI